MLTQSYKKTHPSVHIHQVMRTLWLLCLLATCAVAESVVSPKPTPTPTATPPNVVESPTPAVVISTEPVHILACRVLQFVLIWLASFIWHNS